MEAISIHRFTIYPGLCQQIKWWSKKGKGTKELEQLKHFSTKIQEVTSNGVITEENEKLVTQGAFSNKVTPVIDEPVVQCDVQVVENT